MAEFLDAGGIRSALEFDIGAAIKQILTGKKAVNELDQDLTKIEDTSKRTSDKVNQAANGFNMFGVTTGKASRSVKEINKDIDNLSKKSDKAAKDVRELGDETEKTGKKSKKSSDEFGGGIDGVFSKILNLKSAIAGFAAFQLANFTIGMAKAAFQAAALGASLERQTRAFQNVIGGAHRAIPLLLQVQEASGFTIGGPAAQQALVRATQAGFQFEEIIRLTKLATSVSAVYGVTAEEAFNRLVAASAKMERELLDEYGILVSVKTATESYAAATGKEVDKLTEAERSQSFLNEVLKQGQFLIDKVGDATNMSATDFEKFSTNITKVKNDGLKLLEDFVTPAIKAFNALFDVLGRDFEFKPPDLLGSSLDKALQLQETIKENERQLAIARAVKQSPGYMFRGNVPDITGEAERKLFVEGLQKELDTILKNTTKQILEKAPESLPGTFAKQFKDFSDQKRKLDEEIIRLNKEKDSSDRELATKAANRIDQANKELAQTQEKLNALIVRTSQLITAWPDDFRKSIIEIENKIKAEEAKKVTPERQKEIDDLKRELELMRLPPEQSRIRGLEFKRQELEKQFPDMKDVIGKSFQAEIDRINKETAEKRQSESEREADRIKREQEKSTNEQKRIEEKARAEFDKRQEERRQIRLDTLAVTRSIADNELQAMMNAGMDEITAKEKHAERLIDIRRKQLDVELDEIGDNIEKRKIAEEKAAADIVRIQQDLTERKIDIEKRTNEEIQREQEKAAREAERQNERMLRDRERTFRRIFQPLFEGGDLKDIFMKGIQEDLADFAALNFPVSIPFGDQKGGMFSALLGNMQSGNQENKQLSAIEKNTKDTASGTTEVLQQTKMLPINMGNILGAVIGGSLSGLFSGEVNGKSILTTFLGSLGGGLIQGGFDGTIFGKTPAVTPDQTGKLIDPVINATPLPGISAAPAKQEQPVSLSPLSAFVTKIKEVMDSAMSPKKQPVTIVTESKATQSKQVSELPFMQNIDIPKQEPAKIEFPKHEPAKIEFPKHEPAKIEFPKHEPAKIEFPKHEPQRIEKPKSEFPKLEFPDFSKMFEKPDMPALKSLPGIISGKVSPDIKNNINIPAIEYPKIEIPAIRINQPAAAASNMSTINSLSSVNNNPISIKNDFTFNGETKGITKADIEQAINMKMVESAAKIQKATEANLVKQLRANGGFSQAIRKYQK